MDKMLSTVGSDISRKITN